MTQRQPRQRNKQYLAYIAQLPCVICLAKPVEVAHVRMTQWAEGWEPGEQIWVSGGGSYTTESGPEYRFGKRPTGMGEKPSDSWVCPLCPHCHRTGQFSQHNQGERQFWEHWNIDILQLCHDLQQVYPDLMRGEELVRQLHS